MSAQQQTLADELSDGLRMMPKGASTGHKRKHVEADILPTKIELHNAKRFVLDDDLVRAISHISHNTPADKLISRFSSAVLPYPIVWMELDYRVLFDIQFAYLNATVEERKELGRIGYLLVRSPTNPGAWTLEIVVNTGMVEPQRKYTVKAAPLLLQYGFSPYGVDALKTNAAFRFKNMQTMTDEQRRILSDAISCCWGGADNAGKVLRPEFIDSTFVTIAPSHSTHAIQTSSLKLTEIVKAQATLSWGMLRWVVTALSMLSEVPDVIHAEESGGSVARQSGGKSGYSFHRLTLCIPKDKDPVRYIKRKLDHAIAARKRAHEVRGHWRNYHLKEGCEHTWQQADEDPTYRRCTSCGAFSRFIAEHVRGDETLGWVRKEYILAGAKM